MSKQKYLLIVNDQIVARADSSAEAVRLSKKHPDAGVWKIDDKPVCERMLEFDKGYEARRARRRERRNPVGPAVANICDFVLNDIHETITSAIPRSDLNRDLWGDGSLTIYGKRYRHRWATNVECCRGISQLEVRFDFDVRKPIPQQFARWLRWLSAKALQAADRVAEVDDDRKMKLLHKVINDDKFLDQLWQQKREIVEGGEIEPIPDYMIDLHARRREESGVAA